MKSTALLHAFVLLFAIATAQSCWQNTPCTGPSEPAFTGPWEANNFSPSSRTVQPSHFFPLNDTSDTHKHPSVYPLAENASALVFDFGKEVGGTATIQYSTTDDSGRLGLAFTEAKNWIGLASDSSNGPFARGTGDQACGDGAIYDSFSSAGEHSYTMDLKHLRGGFRYLTLFLLTNGTTTLNIKSVDLDIGFAPNWPNLRAYQGYFHSSDNELNKIWYAGAYTLQTNLIPSHSGRAWNPYVTVGWANNGTLSNGTSAIVDGAKRDRSVWPGDMGVAVPSALVSIGDLDAVMNALQSLYDLQTSEGELPRAGLPILGYDGDTYHCWGLIGTHNYVLYTGDMSFLTQNWYGYQKGVNYVYKKVLPTFGLLNVTGTGDWGRLNTAGYSTEANVILYKTLTTGAELAGWMKDHALQATYEKDAETLRQNIVKHLYDSSYGAFRDNKTNTPIHPQDANSMALTFGLVPNSSKMATSISESLTRNWTPIGAETPELPDNISPFISSFEIQGHFTVGSTARALELIRRCWGWYLKNENGTQSTVVEGYLTNGSFGYRNYDGYEWDSSYTSHAHGWSAGPTSALTNFVLGLSVTDREGSSWRLAPQFGDLKSVEGGFTTGLGKFQADWHVQNDGGEYVVNWAMPKGTTGSIELPGLPSGADGIVTHNGKTKGKIKVGSRLQMRVTGGGKQRVTVRKS